MNLIKHVYTVQCTKGRYYYCQEKLAGKKSKIEENTKKLYFKETKQNCDKTSNTVQATTRSIQVYTATRIEGR